MTPRDHGIDDEEAIGWSEFRSDWRLLIAAMIGVGAGLPGLLYNSIGVFAPVLVKAYGWSFGSILGGLAVVTLTLLTLGPIVGRVVDRHGARALAASSLALLGVAYMGLSLTRGSLPAYYAVWAVLSFVGLGATPISFTRAVSRAFVRRRGLALGLTLAGTGVFVILVKPLAQSIVANFGWQAGIVAVGMLPIVFGVPAVLWGLPKNHQGRGIAAPPVNEPVQSGLSLNQAVRTRAFWIMVAVFLPVSFASAAPLPNLENILASIQLRHEDIIRLTSLVGLTVILGRILGGWLLDRLWAPLVGSIIFGAAGAATAVLSQAALSFPVALPAVLVLGLAAGVELDLMSYLVARYFGLRSYGTIYGIMYGLFAVGGGTGPALFGLAYDRTRSYSAVLLVCSAFLLLSMIVLLGLGRYPPRLDRQ